MWPSVDPACNKLFASSRLTRYEHRRITWRDLGNAREHRLQCGRSSNDLLKHRCLVDFFAESDVFLLQPLFISFAVVDIGASGIPTQDLSLLVAHGVVTNQKPAVASIALPQPPFAFKSRATRYGTVPHSLDAF